jgi:hypothetical protein
VFSGTQPLENQSGAFRDPKWHIYEENPGQHFVTGKSEPHEKLDGAMKTNRGEAHAGRPSAPQQSEEKEELDKQPRGKEYSREIGMLRNQVGQPFRKGRLNRFKGIVVVVGLGLDVWTDRLGSSVSQRPLLRSIFLIAVVR